VQVDIVDRPATGRDHLPRDLEVIKIAESSGALEGALEVEINQALGYDVEIGNINVEKVVITQWDNQRCAVKIKELVNGFLKSYTCQQVPSAIYHACTNFLTKASFSLDQVAIILLFVGALKTLLDPSRQAGAVDPSRQAGADGTVDPSRQAGADGRPEPTGGRRRRGHGCSIDFGRAQPLATESMGMRQA
jgi:hypothetical protein